MLLPTTFLGLAVLAVLFLALDVFRAALISFDGVGLLSLGLLVLASTAGLQGAEGFLETDSGLAGVAAFGVSGLLALVEAGRVSGEAVDFLAAGVAGLLASFLMGVGLFVDVVGARPAEGVLAGDGLAVEVVVLAADGVVFDAVVGVLGVAGEADFGAADAGREAVVPVAGLDVLETGGLSVLGEEVVLGLAVAAEAGLGAEDRGFGLAFSPLTGVFLAGCVVPVVFGAPTGFFSVVLLAVLVVTAPMVPTGFLEAVVVVFFSAAAPAVVFLATPLACGGFCTPFVMRL